MTAPNAEVHALKRSQTRVSNEAKLALRAVAQAAEQESTTEVRLALVWLELARGESSIVDGFFTADRCYLILKTRLDGSAEPLEGRRLEILEAVLAGSRQKNIAIDLDLAPSTVALNSKLALESLGAVGKPSRAHPLLMLLARASAESYAWRARAATFVVHDDSELRVVGIPRPDRDLGQTLPAAELAVIRSLIEGHSYQEIARDRGTSTRTIANQISAVFRRMRVSGRNELVQRLFHASSAAEGPSAPHETLAPPPLPRTVPPTLGSERRSA